MTSEGQRRGRGWNQFLRMALFAGLAVGILASPVLTAATTEYVVANRYSGLAIDGFDPVAYFTEASPRLGKGEFEYRHAGAVWRFRNEGNRAAFAADPDVYAPRFGGYDPVDVARGAAVAGNPRLWIIIAERLYLFYSIEHLTAFGRDSDRLIAAASRQWPQVRRTLSP
jgi:hypothetical protein